MCGTLKKDPATQHIPILMLTAKAQRQDQEVGLQAGADAFLTKPFHLEELLEKARALLSKSGGAPTPPTDAAPPA